MCVRIKPPQFPGAALRRFRVCDRRVRRSSSRVIAQRWQVGFEGAQRVRRRVPVVTLAPEEGVVVKTGFSSELTFGEPGNFEGGSEASNRLVNHPSSESISEYAPQEQKHTDICSKPNNVGDMPKTADAKREILRRFIVERGLKIATWAKEAGVDKNSVYNFLNGHSQALSSESYQKLTKAARVPLWKLTGDEPDLPSPTSIWVSGRTETGNFVASIEWPEIDWYAVDVPIAKEYQGRAKAFEVRGACMDVEYPSGSVVVWVETQHVRPLREGDHVIALTTRTTGETEVTLRELRFAEGQAWLWPRSRHPAHQNPANTAVLPEGIASIEIKGIVLGDYRPRVI
jgi:hypothetical protein